MPNCIDKLSQIIFSPPPETDTKLNGREEEPISSLVCSAVLGKEVPRRSEQKATGKKMQTDIELIGALTDEQTRTFSARIDGVEIYRSQYTSIGIEVLRESTVDPRGHQLLTFHINDNPIPVHSISLEANRIGALSLLFPKLIFSNP